MTLRVGGELRGCIGTMESDGPAGETAERMAAAALRDPELRARLAVSPGENSLFERVVTSRLDQWWAVADGDMTGKQRNQLLRDMTDDVARLVLADNYAQTQAISISEMLSAARLDETARLISEL